MVNPRTIAKLEARIHERAAHALEFEVRDPRASFITITRVELSPDISIAKIYYSVLGTKADRSKAEHMLLSASGFIQRQVARVLETRRVPRLVWHFDESLIKAQELDQTIRKALERDKVIAETGKPPEDDDDADWEAEYEDFADETGPKPPKDGA
jgi:ribosome-binding factor A